MMKILTILTVTAAVLFFNFTPGKKGLDPKLTGNITTQNDEPKIKINTILTDQEIIWGMDFLPNGDIIFTEKKGNIKLFSGQKITEISGMPKVASANQGGLLDIKVHPKYTKNGWIYVNYASQEPNGACQINLIRFKLDGNKMSSVENLFHTSATNKWRGHYGGRIEFDKNDKLFLSIGEGGSGSRGGANSINQNAQNVKEAWGKVHRMNDDGTVPKDNPILTGNTEPTTVYSYGHRNPQGLIMDQATQELYEVEHGPKGGDEINLIKKGNNYGWPLISYGVNYDDVKVSDSPKLEGMTDPIFAYVPSIGTCGLAIITSNKFKGWKTYLVFYLWRSLR